MLYYLFKFVMGVVFRTYYRKRYLTGFDQIPATGPVIFACNHPNSFLDAMLIGAWIKREVHFLTRSDVFNTPLKLWILSRFKMIPIYRLQEGVENLDKNKDTFDRCHRIFEKGGAVLIFSEGLCIQEMRLRPLKKGAARIAMEYSKDGSALTIIPTGINYLKPTVFREAVAIKMEIPFNAADFAAEFNENNSRGINAFNKRLEEGLLNAVINNQDKKADKELELLIEIENNQAPGKLERLIQSAKEVSQLAKAADPKYNSLVTKLGSYRALLEKHMTDDSTIASDKSGTWAKGILQVFIGMAMLPLGLPLYFANRITKKAVKRVEFYDSVLLGAAGIFYLLYTIAVYVVLGVIIGWLVAVGVIAVLALVGVLAVVAYDGVKDSRQSKEYSELKKQRSEILVLRKAMSATS